MKRLSLLLFLGMMTFLLPVRAQVPRTISFQGVLTDDQGLPLDDGTYTLHFRLAAEDAPGTTLWEEQHADVSVSDGLFSVVLGSTEPLDLPFDVPYVLGISVDGGPEMTPLVNLTAAPYSLRAAAVADSSVTGAQVARGELLRSLNGLHEDVELIAGENVTITVEDQTIRIAAAGGGNGGGTGEAWNLTGNAGTTPGAHFVGTTDETPLEVKVNGERALRLEPGDSPNVIGGHGDNAVTEGVVGATVGGGGAQGDLDYNVVTDDYGTVGGGQGNRAGDDAGATDDQRFATVGGGKGNTATRVAATVAGGNANEATGNYATVTGGRQNTASSPYAAVGGGRNNEVLASYGTIAGGGPGDPNDAAGTNNRVFDDYGAIGGGGENRAGSDDGDASNASYATVGGGFNNTASGSQATVAGGGSNTAGGSGATVAGGSSNTASGLQATVAGGDGNTAGGSGATVAGGSSNTASGLQATVAGGNGNTASGDYSVVAGGLNNTAAPGFTFEAGRNTVGGGQDNTATGDYATVGGGVGNTASGSAAVVGGGQSNTASAKYATVPGGINNVAGGNYSFAAGYGAIVDANHSGTFVWSSSQSNFASTGGSQFLVEAAGGVGLGTNAPQAQLHVQEAVDGTATLANHVAIIENNAASTSNGPDVLALKTSAVNPTGTTNFVTFFDGNEQNIGRIEGNGSGGVVYGTTGGDYAEALPLLSPGEAVEAGDIVGVVAGRVTRRTAGAHRMMVITDRPAVLGNLSIEDREDSHVPVAFVGQVPVKVWGPVRAGDFILPSGREDGTGAAVAPEALSPEDAARIVGQAWEDAPGAGLHRVNVLVGLDHRDVLIARQQAELQLLRQRLDTLERQLNLLLGAHPAPAQ